MPRFPPLLDNIQTVSNVGLLLTVFKDEGVARPPDKACASHPPKAIPIIYIDRVSPPPPF